MFDVEREKLSEGIYGVLYSFFLFYFFKFSICNRVVMTELNTHIPPQPHKQFIGLIFFERGEGMTCASSEVAMQCTR